MNINLPPRLHGLLYMIVALGAGILMYRSLSTTQSSSLSANGARVFGVISVYVFGLIGLLEMICGLKWHEITAKWERLNQWQQAGFFLVAIVCLIGILALIGYVYIESELS